MRRTCQHPVELASFFKLFPVFVQAKNNALLVVGENSYESGNGLLITLCQKTKKAYIPKGPTTPLIYY